VEKTASKDCLRQWTDWRFFDRKLDFLNELVYYIKVTKKQQFLLEHNRLSPLNLQATMFVLSRFKTEKASLFRDNNWSIDKLRRPFILWLTSVLLREKGNINKKEKI